MALQKAGMKAEQSNSTPVLKQKISTDWPKAGVKPTARTRLKS
jgi:hypothetical protein